LRLQKRRIDYLRWVRVHGYQERKLHLSERSGKKLAKLIEALTETELKNDIQNDINKITNDVDDLDLIISPDESLDASKAAYDTIDED
jgi:hypothetical protein